MPTSRPGRIGLALLLTTAFGVSLILIITVLTLFRTSGQELPGGDIPGGDFAMLFTAGVMVSEGRGTDAYDKTSFGHTIERETPTSRRDAFGDRVGYRYPPPMAQVLSLLAPLGFPAAFVAWTIGGLIALAVALRTLHGRSSGFLIFLAVASVPGWFTLRVGQAAFYWLLVVAVAFALGERQSYFAAGAVTGLLIFKPTLLAVLVILLLVRGRAFGRVLAGVAVAIVTILSVSFVLDPEMWFAYLSVPFEAVSDLSKPGFLVYTFSLPDSLLLSGLPSVLVWIAAATALIGATVYVKRRVDHTWLALIAIAVALTLFAIPHMFVYDWMLLAVPMLALWHRMAAQRDLVWLGAGIASIAALMSPAIVMRMVPAWGWSFHIATVVLAILLVAIARELSRRQTSSELTA